MGREQPARVAVGAVAVLLVFSTGLVFFSTDLTTNDSYRTKVEAVEGQDLLAKSFPAGASAPTDVVVPSRAEVPRVRAAVARVDGVETVSGPVAEGDEGVLIQAILEPPPYSTEAFDLIDPIRDAAHGPPRARSSAVRPRSSSTCARRRPGTRRSSRRSCSWWSSSSWSRC